MTNRESRLEAIVRELADEVEADVRARWNPDGKGVHPANEHRYRRDMDLVERARAALALPAEPSGDQQRRMTGSMELVGGRASQCGCGAWWRTGDELVEWFCDKHRPAAPEPSDAREGG